MLESHRNIPLLLVSLPSQSSNVLLIVCATRIPVSLEDLWMKIFSFYINSCVYFHCDSAESLQDLQ